MPAPQLPELESRDVVSVETADLMVSDVRSEIVELEAELRRIEREANEAESRIEANSLTSPFALRSLASASDFIALMHTQNREQMRRAFEAVEASAAERVREAQDEANAILAAARSVDMEMHAVEMAVESVVEDHVDPVEVTDEPELLGSEEAYEKFCREQVEAPKPRGASFAVVGVLLPVVVLVVVLCVALILVG